MKFELDDEFRMRNRRQTDKERTTLGILIEMEGCLQDSLTVAQIGPKLLLCDGYTTLSICEEKGIKPTAPRLIPFPDRQSVLEWIDRRADGRRNLTEKDVAERKERIAKAKGEGMSTRAIAAQEGVSQTQVQRDLQTQVNPPGSPEKPKTTTPTPASTTGKDGKQYPANEESKLFCRECRIRGVKKGCPQCKEKRQKAGMGGGGNGSKPKKIGAETFNWKDFTKHYGFVVRGVDELKKLHPGDDGIECEALLRQFGEVFRKWKKRATAS